MPQETLIAVEEPLLKRTAEPLMRPATEARAMKRPAESDTEQDLSVSSMGAAPVWSRLDFLMLQQEQANWCWCATALSVHKYFNPTSRLRQCDAANIILGRTDACTNPTHPDVNTGWILEDSLTDLGNFFEQNTGGMMSWADVKTQIDMGRPVGARTAWSGGGAHFVCIEGYLEGATPMIAVDDPAGGQSDVNFEVFKTAYGGSGSWTHNYRVQSSRIRILNAQVPAGAAVTAVSRHPQRLDAFVVDNGGNVLTAATDDALDKGPWRGWWAVAGGKATPGAPVTCVERGPNKLDIFVVGIDGGIYTAAWDQNVEKGNWRGWWRIGTVVAPQGSRIAAVSRTADHLDIFVVDVNGNVMSAAWQTGDTTWRGWWHIQGGKAKPGAYISVVSRHPQKLDIFLAAPDTSVMTAAWDQNVDKGNWRGWWGVAGGKIPSGAPVTAVARDANKLDVFAVASDGKVYTAAWDQHVDSAKWRGWWPVAGGVVPPGSVVSCVARDANKLDVMAVAGDGRLYTAAWDQHVAGAKWRGWWVIGNGAFQPGIETTLLSRGGGSLDGFGAGTDGGVYVVYWNHNRVRQQWQG